MAAHELLREEEEIAASPDRVVDRQGVQLPVLQGSGVCGGGRMSLDPPIHTQLSTP